MTNVKPRSDQSGLHSTEIVVTLLLDDSKESQFVRDAYQRAGVQFRIVPATGSATEVPAVKTEFYSLQGFDNIFPYLPQAAAGR